MCSLTVAVHARVNKYIFLGAVSVLQLQCLSPPLSVAPLVETEMETFSTQTSWDIIDQDDQIQPRKVWCKS